MKRLSVLAASMLWCACAAWAGDLQSAPPVRLVTAVRPELPAYKQFSDAMDMAFKALKRPYTLTFNPAERAVTAFKSGLFDGDLPRGPTYDKTYPEAIRVDPALVSALYVGVVRAGGITVASWDDLAKYRIAYRRGFKSIESLTAHVPNKTYADSYESCVRMVRDEHVDVCIAVSAGIKPLLPLDKQFAVHHIGHEKLHLWLGPQHKELAQTLGRVLTEMQKRGDLDQIFREFN